MQLRNSKKREYPKHTPLLTYSPRLITTQDTSRWKGKLFIRRCPEDCLRIKPRANWLSFLSWYEKEVREVLKDERTTVLDSCINHIRTQRGRLNPLS